MNGSSDKSYTNNIKQGLCLYIIGDSITHVWKLSLIKKYAYLFLNKFLMKNQLNFDISWI